MKTALIGYGYWGKIIRRYIESSKSFQLVKICCKEQVDGKDNLFTTDINIIWNDSDIETVFICTPVATHFEICRQGLLNGKNVFCEKPTVRTSEEFEELAYLAKKQNKILFTDYIYTVSPSIMKMKEELPEIGTISGIEGEISQFGNFYPQDTVFEVLGVHLFSVLGYLVPDLKIDSCKSSYLFDLNLYSGMLQAKINGNIQVLFTCSLLNVKKIRIIKIYGTRGTLVFDMMDKEATLYLQKYENQKDGVVKGGEFKNWKFDENNNLVRILLKFREAIVSGDNQENLKVARIVNRLLENCKGS